MAITYTYEFPESPKVQDITINGVDYVNLISELVFKKIGTDDNGVTAEITDTMYFAITEEFLNTSALTPFADLTHAKIVEWMEIIGTESADEDIEEAIRNKISTVSLPF
jgi:hypothetical protein|tara:strand:+ start:776 stop:1102 length:327 start_codon:yes stop_codon:yes gene_type:complete